MEEWPDWLRASRRVNLLQTARDAMADALAEVADADSYDRDDPDLETILEALKPMLASIEAADKLIAVFKPRGVMFGKGAGE